MSTFDSTKTHLKDLLKQITEGKLQLPDFQRGWVWDDEHIRSLLVSIARSFPIGAVMILETGGDTRFQVRPIEGVALPSPAAGLAEELILDGQQRLTSLTQVLKLDGPVRTRDAKKKELQLHYYFNIQRALEGPEHLFDALVAVPADKMLRSDFGRKIELDLTSPEKEIAEFYFPCSQVLDSSRWEYAVVEAGPEQFKNFMQFREKVLEPFRNYMLPVIRLTKETSKEAVCLVFEKVNTGGVPLSVFELVTATWAADGFNLREDWLGASGNPGRKARLARRPLLKDLQPTDFLQGVSLLSSLHRRQADLKAFKTGKEIAAVTAKREHVLELPLGEYRTWADRLTEGFEQVDRFLRQEGFHHPRYLPYRTQLIPLAVVMTQLGERWLEPQLKAKLARWYWSGVLGELYGGAVETRIALDVLQLQSWLDDTEAMEPATVQAAGFNPNRLDTLRTRTSAAYRGLYVLLQREGACDFFWKVKMVDLDRDDAKLDLHHIFPKKWCEENRVNLRIADSIVNKTPISYKANRMIGGRAPSEYLNQIQTHAQVLLSSEAMDGILRTHIIEPSLLRSDSFEAFYEARKSALLHLVERAMGKPTLEASEESVDEEFEFEEEELQDSVTSTY